MNRRTFALDDQRDFAILSGDSNPLHTDPLAARRLLFGQAVVHGIHLVLWAIDRWSEGRPSPFSLAALAAEFRAPVGVGEEVGWKTLLEEDRRVEIEIAGSAGRSARVLVDWRDRADGAPPPRVSALAEAGECRVLTFEEALAASGRTDLVLDPQSAGRLFPSLARSLPPAQLAAVLATTRIVGMLCPGLHSLYAGLDLRFSEASPDPGPLRYAVAAHDRRFSSLQISIDGSGATGSLKAFFRPPPRAQTAFAELKALVGGDEFAGRRALIVGGSRGLGEVAAKLLAAGGARVALTYKVGAAEAEQVVAEIARGGGHAASLRFDVLRPGDGLPEVDGEPFLPDMLCYFAAPFIGSGSRGSFSAQSFGAFCAYFVDGFIGTVRAARGLEPRRLRVLYPSSVFVEEPPSGQGEYAAAKSAGEAACRWLQKTDPELTVHVHRFPRMSTDQTASLLPQPAAEPAPLVLESLRRLRDAG